MRLHKKGIDAFAVHPGIAKTPLAYDKVDRRKIEGRIQRSYAKVSPHAHWSGAALLDSCCFCMSLSSCKAGASSAMSIHAACDLPPVDDQCEFFFSVTWVPAA